MGAVALLVVGGMVLSGWFAGIPAFVTWGAAAPAPVNGALALLMLAFALFGRAYRGRLWLLVAVLPALANLWTLLEIWPGVPAGFDQWLSDHRLVGSSTPGRVAPVVACGLFLIGATLAVSALPGAGRWRTLLLAGVGSLVGGAGLAALLGHATGLEAARTLGWEAAVSLPMAAGLLLLGCINVAVAVGDRPAGSPPARWLPAPLMFGCATATVIVWLALRDSQVADSVANLENVVLGAGLAFSLLLGLVVDLAQAARQRQTEAEAAAARIIEEDRERRRLASQLKASEDRLGLALEAGQIGTFDWDLITGEAHFGAEAWQMLGYQAAFMSSKMAHWDSLIHPEEREEAAAGRAKAPRSGFRENEYRIRSAEDNWRWVLERSRAVAFGNEGVVRRIAGTVHDITPRKRAEEELRLSQSEARKLAAVASATDNWVAILGPDGAVEWVNRSFCRGMGCAAKEAYGRRLDDLLQVKPDDATSHALLREAFVRRLPAMGEVVARSRAGREFHLHAEIQPVAAGGGEIERYIAVFHDISARVETEALLLRAKAKAEEASRAKSEFLASMSHEIRTPMNGVIGLSRLLLDSPLNADQQDWVRTIHLSGNSLLAIINDILDFSKIESGRLDLERYPFSTADCVEEALELFAVPAGEKRLELSYCVAPGVPETVVGDVVRLRQVLVNLISNAVKFTPAGGVSVEVRPGETAQQVAFTVTDTGVGIPASQVDALFQPFSQGDSSTTRRFGGTGLGLAICRRLVELMGGTIGVHSREQGGSVFHFTADLPAAPASLGAVAPAAGASGKRAVVVDEDPVATRFVVQVLENDGYLVRCFESAEAAGETLADSAAPDLAIVDHTPAGGDGFAAARMLRTLFPEAPMAVVLLSLAGQVPARERLKEAGIDGFAVKPLRRRALHDRIIAATTKPGGGAPDPAPAALPAPGPKLAETLPLRVLLAEDNPVNKKVALRLLERFGYGADCVGTGAEAVRKVEEGNYQLVFMDVQMPDMDGLEATRLIRARLPKERQPVIVALTANAIAGDAEKCREAGMDDYVRKPVTPEELRDAIVRCCGGAGAAVPSPVGGEP